MKKNLFTILFLASIASKLFAQSITTTDSLSMTIGTAVDVYYNLQTGKKDTVNNRNWHLAFAVRNAQPPTKTMQAATVLINEGRGVSLFETNKTLADWNTFDTTGWNTWKPAYNSDSSWDVGAFNKNRDTAQSFDYGWENGKFNGGEFGNASLGTNSVWFNGEFNGGIFIGRFWNNGIFSKGDFIGSGTYSLYSSNISSINEYNYVNSYTNSYYGLWNNGYVTDNPQNIKVDERVYTELTRKSEDYTIDDKATLKNMLW